MSINFSITFPTFDKAENIEYLLWSLDHQTLPKDLWEILIIDDKSNDSELLKEICKKYEQKMNLRYIYNLKKDINKWGWGSPVFPLNIGIKQSQGSIWMGGDPAGLFTPEALEKFYCPHLLKNKDEKTLVTSWLNEAIAKEAVQDIYKQNRPDLIWLIEGQRMLEPQKHLDLLTGSRLPFKSELVGSFSIRKKWLEEIGGFNEDLLGLYGQFDDIRNRLRRFKCRELFFKEFLIVHQGYHKRCIRPPEAFEEEKLVHKYLQEAERDNIIYVNQDREWGML